MPRSVYISSLCRCRRRQPTLGAVVGGIAFMPPLMVNLAEFHTCLHLQKNEAVCTMHPPNLTTTNRPHDDDAWLST